MSWPPNCPYHAWRPLAGPLKAGRCSLSRHSLVQLIHHKQLQRFKDFEVAGYQLEDQRLTDPTKSKCEKKQDDERKGGIFCAFGVKLTIGDGVNLRCCFETSTWSISIYLDTSRFLEGRNSRLAVPHEPRLLQLWFRVAMAFRPPPRQSGEVCLVGCVFNIYFQKPGIFLKGCLRMFDV